MIYADCQPGDWEAEIVSRASLRQGRSAQRDVGSSPTGDDEQILPEHGEAETAEFGATDTPCRRCPRR